MKLIGFKPAFLKGASRTVKRIIKDYFSEVKDDTLTELLGIPSLVVTMYLLHKEGEEEVLHLWCVHRDDVAICPGCGGPSTQLHDSQHRCIRHLEVWGKKTYLHFAARRFFCEHCGHAFTEELSFVQAHRRQSIAFERHIYQCCCGSNKKRVALREALSHSTVREIFHRWVRARRTGRLPGSIRVLGIDEISLKKRHRQFALVLCDIDRRCVVDILADRDKETLEHWLQSLGDKRRKKIRVVSMDMWAPYRQAVSKKLPHARIVVDRFHVIKQLNQRLGQLRRSLHNKADAGTKAILKGSRWILVMNRDRLNEAQNQHLEQVLDVCPQLRSLYLHKEKFSLVFNRIKDRRQAVRFLRAWIYEKDNTADRYLAKFIATLQNWWEEILNYFPERITNGFVEGVNGALRSIIRIAFGYRNFENFRDAVFACLGIPTN
jgi:transposase